MAVVVLETPPFCEATERICDGEGDVMLVELRRKPT